MLATTTKMLRRWLLIALILPSMQTLAELRPGVESALDTTGKQAVSSLNLGNLAGQAVIGHAGSIDGFTANIYYFVDKQISVVMLTNAEGGTQGLGGAITQALFGTSSP